MTIYDMLLDIHALEEEMLNFERKYGIRTEILYAAYANGEEPEDDEWVLDFGEWASIYMTWLTRQAEYRNMVQPPDDPTLQATHPHHKHLPPDVKHHRIPAPMMSFTQPNLPELVREIKELLNIDVNNIS